MTKTSKGNILITFIMIVSLAVTVFSFLYFITVKLKESGNQVNEMKAFYAADAGINKAIWYLSTATGSGGKGLTWRVSSTYEAFDDTGFYISVQNTASSSEVMIMSTGESNGVRKTIYQTVSVGGFPVAFEYAMYTSSALSLSGNAEIFGDVYVNGNTAFSGNGNVSDGMIYHAAGANVSGHGTWTDGGTPTPVPPFPTLDTSYYTGEIAVASGVTAGNITYSNNTYNLSGGTVYVKGNVTISGNTTFTGPGTIVATGTFNMSGNTYTSGGTVNFISGGAIGLSGNTYTTGAVFYSNTSVAVSGNTRVQVGGMLSAGTTSLSGNTNISGLLYSNGIISMSGNPIITGTVVSGSASGVSGLSGNARIVYDDSVFPSILPTGFTATSLTRKMGTWKVL